MLAIGNLFSSQRCQKQSKRRFQLDRLVHNRVFNLLLSSKACVFPIKHGSLLVLRVVFVVLVDLFGWRGVCGVFHRQVTVIMPVIWLILPELMCSF